MATSKLLGSFGDGTNAQLVSTAGDQNIDGIKTFLSQTVFNTLTQQDRFYTYAFSTSATAMTLTISAGASSGRGMCALVLFAGQNNGGRSGAWIIMNGGTTNVMTEIYSNAGGTSPLNLTATQNDSTALVITSAAVTYKSIWIGVVSRSQPTVTWA